MSDLQAQEYKVFEKIKKRREDGTEYWNARELCEVLQYRKWENFVKVIDRAKLACNNSGLKIQDHFPEVRKMVEIGSNTIRKAIKDIGGTMPEDLPTPEKSIKQVEKEQLKRLNQKNTKLRLDE